MLYGCKSHAKCISQQGLVYQNTHTGWLKQQKFISHNLEAQDQAQDQGAKIQAVLISFKTYLRGLEIPPSLCVLPWPFLCRRAYLVSSFSYKDTSLIGLGSTLMTSFNLQFSSVAHLCLTLCDSMNCSTPGFPVRYKLPESTQTHVRRVGDAIQPSHPLLSPSLPALNLSQHQGLFK